MHMQEVEGLEVGGGADEVRGGLVIRGVDEVREMRGGTDIWGNTL